MMLADLGAEVIKVNPLHDFYWMSTHIAMACNRGKRSIAHQPQGSGRRWRSSTSSSPAPTSSSTTCATTPPCASASTTRACARIKPDLIYCHTRGFEHGAREGLPGNDQTGAALAGLDWLDGGLDHDGIPLWPVMSLGDTGNGFLSAIGMVQALYHRDRTGEGQFVDTSIMYAQLLNASIAWSLPMAAATATARASTRCNSVTTQPSGSTRLPTGGCASRRPLTCSAARSRRRWASTRSPTRPCSARSSRVPHPQRGAVVRDLRRRGSALRGLEPRLRARSVRRSRDDREGLGDEVPAPHRRRHGAVRSALRLRGDARRRAGTAAGARPGHPRRSSRSSVTTTTASMPSRKRRRSWIGGRSVPSVSRRRPHSTTSSSGTRSPRVGSCSSGARRAASSVTRPRRCAASATRWSGTRRSRADTATCTRGSCRTTPPSPTPNHASWSSSSSTKGSASCRTCSVCPRKRSPTAWQSRSASRTSTAWSSRSSERRRRWRVMALSRDRHRRHRPDRVLQALGPQRAPARGRSGRGRDGRRRAHSRRLDGVVPSPWTPTTSSHDAPQRASPRCASRPRTPSVAAARRATVQHAAAARRGRRRRRGASCYRAFNERSGRRFGQPIAGTERACRRAWNWYLPFGLDTPAKVDSLWYQRYMHTYGITNADFGRYPGGRPQARRHQPRTRGSTSSRSPSRSTRRRAGSSNRSCAARLLPGERRRRRARRHEHGPRP